MKTFLDTKAASRVTGKHQAKLKFELEHFSQFVLGKGLENLGDIKTEHVVAYRNSLTGAQNTRAKKVFRLIGFFRFCVEMGWIQRNIAQARAVKLKSTTGRHRRLSRIASSRRCWPLCRK